MNCNDAFCAIFKFVCGDSGSGLRHDFKGRLFMDGVADIGGTTVTAEYVGDDANTVWYLRADTWEATRSGRWNPKYNIPFRNVTITVTGDRAAFERIAVFATLADE